MVSRVHHKPQCLLLLFGIFLEVDPVLHVLLELPLLTVLILVLFQNKIQVLTLADIENGKPQYYSNFVTAMRKFYSSASKQYYMAASPQYTSHLPKYANIRCIFPDASLGTVLDASSFEYCHLHFEF